MESPGKNPENPQLGRAPGSPACLPLPAGGAFSAPALATLSPLAASPAWAFAGRGLPSSSALTQPSPSACPAGLAHHPPTSHARDPPGSAPTAGYKCGPARGDALGLSQGSLRRVRGAAGHTRLPDIRVLRTLHYISHRPPGHVQTADFGSECGLHAPELQCGVRVCVCLLGCVCVMRP